LEDILSTYCVDNNQGGSGEDGAQGEPSEPKDAEKSRTFVARNGEPEPVTPVVNGEKETSKGEPGTEEIRTSDEVGDRDHRRPQEKKKAKGLGTRGQLLVRFVRGGRLDLLFHGLACFASIQRKLLFRAAKASDVGSQHRCVQVPHCKTSYPWE
jgi:hypothetical protein